MGVLTQFGSRPLSGPRLAVAMKLCDCKYHSRLHNDSNCPGGSVVVKLPGQSAVCGWVVTAYCGQTESSRNNTTVVCPLRKQSIQTDPDPG